MLGVALLGGSRTWQLGRQVADAREIQRAVERVGDHVEADLVTNERVYLLGAVVVGASYGADAEALGQLTGIDVDARLAEGDERMDRVLAHLDPADPLRARLTSLWARLTLDAIGDGPDAAGRVAVASRASGNLSAHALDDAEALFFDDDAGADLRRLHTVVRTSVDAMNDIGFQIEATGFLFGATDSAERAARMGRLRAATADYERDRATIERLVTGAGARRWQRTEGSSAARANAAWLANLSTTDVGALPDLGPLELAGPIGGGLDRMHELGAFSRAALADADGLARDVGRAATLRLWANLGIAAVLVAATALLIVRIVRSINRPMLGLAAAAGRASTGDLAGTDLPTGGPPEVRRVTETLREVLANLRNTEGQVAALAAGDLDADVLGEAVPGRLGLLLHDSFGRLSRAMGAQEELRRRLEHEATHDPLTGLPNRAASRTALAAALDRGRRAGRSVAVLYLDLDGFKQVNDAHGHGAGDHVLVETARRLAATVRGGDLVARVGGDEFVVIAEQLTDARDVVELGERLIARVTAPIRIGSVATRIGASVGVAIALDGELDPDALLRDADLAVYRAKALGRARVELFDKDLRREVARRVDVEQALRTAITRSELELHFQPVVTPAGTPHSLEALVRWRRHGHGVVPPDEFVPVAEASDLIIDLDRWVLAEACRHLAAWHDDPVLGALTLSVNLSGRHLLSLTVVDDVRAALDATGADPTRLVLEITETAVMTDLALVIDHLEQLRLLGPRIAIDDFGTGYTSITHLRALPIDVVKIDRSMVTGEQANDAHVLKLLVDTAHALGLGLVAEGVETEAQLARLEALGCDHIQGFLFSRPVPGDELRSALGRVRPRG
jgi:diguanylate cyclase (GGDEF)-like protein